MLTDPVAFSCGDLERKIDIVTRVISSIDPFRDAQIRIEKDDKVGVYEFASGFANLEPRWIPAMHRYLPSRRPGTVW